MCPLTFLPLNKGIHTDFSLVATFGKRLDYKKMAIAARRKPPLIGATTSEGTLEVGRGRSASPYPLRTLPQGRWRMERGYGYY